jgi:hypothetical protein
MWKILNIWKKCHILCQLLLSHISWLHSQLHDFYCNIFAGNYSSGGSSGKPATRSAFTGSHCLFALQISYIFSSTLKMEAIRSSETSVNTTYTQCQISEDCFLQTCIAFRLWPWKMFLVFLCHFIFLWHEHWQLLHLRNVNLLKVTFYIRHLNAKVGRAIWSSFYFGHLNFNTGCIENFNTISRTNNKINAIFMQI